MSILTLFSLVLLSLACSAFFSGMEIAFISSNKLKIELDNNKGEISAKIFLISATSQLGLLLLCL